MGFWLKNSRPAYALLSEWVKKTKILNQDESLKELARRYFSSHGPASLEDFEWWSGLSLNDSKKALEYNRSDLTSETFGNQTYWFENAFTRRTSITDKLYLLPAYDDFLISYRDRRAPLTFKNQKGVVSKNGVFYPTIVLNGRVIGIWKYAVKNDRVTIEINPFEKQNSGNDYDFSGASAQFADFIDKKAEIVNFKK